jgi:hypothetical protein
MDHVDDNLDGFSLLIVFRFVSPAVFTAIRQRAVFSVIFLASGAIPVTAAGICAFTGLIDLFRHDITSDW